LPGMLYGKTRDRAPVEGAISIEFRRSRRQERFKGRSSNSERLPCMGGSRAIGRQTRPGSVAAQQVLPTSVCAGVRTASPGFRQRPKRSGSLYRSGNATQTGAGNVGDFFKWGDYQKKRKWPRAAARWIRSIFATMAYMQQMEL